LTLSDERFLRGLAAAVANAAKRSSSVLMGTELFAVRGSGLASGPWGLTLALAEASRRLQEPSLLVAARQCLSEPVEVTRGGAFTGPEGHWIARAACGLEPLPGVIPVGNDRGDLMDGAAGEMWAAACLGAAPPISALPVGPRTDERPGLAHGRLGAVAAMIFSGSVEARELEAQLDMATQSSALGWCNGLAGAVATIMIGHSSGVLGGDWLGIARDLTYRLLHRAGELQDDSLCHGLAGVLVVSAGVTRVLREPGLVAQLSAAALDLCDDARGFRATNDAILDATWLTGVTGVLWALLVSERQPEVNPILPIDAVRWKGPSTARAK
jgi:hypothetical protein